MSLNVFTSSYVKTTLLEFFLRMERISEGSHVKGNQGVTVRFKGGYTSDEVNLAYRFNS